MSDVSAVMNDGVDVAVGTAGSRLARLSESLKETGSWFGLRASCAALAALWLAMWLELDIPRWAAWTVMSVALPTRGQVATKATYRLLGTIAGLAGALVCFAELAQAPLMAMAVVSGWFALQTFLASRWEGFRGYAAALAGLTLTLILTSHAATPLKAFDTALSRGANIAVGILVAYIAAAMAEALSPPPEPAAAPVVPLPSAAEALANAARAGLTVSAACAIWSISAWPSGADFVTFSGVTVSLFAVMPEAHQRARSFLLGSIVGSAAGILIKYQLLLWSASFPLLALTLFPFLFVGAVGVADARTTTLAAGFNLSFLVAIEPDNPMTYDLAGSLNASLAMLLGIAFGADAYVVILPRRSWRQMAA